MTLIQKLIRLELMLCFSDVMVTCMYNPFHTIRPYLASERPFPDMVTRFLRLFYYLHGMYLRIETCDERQVH